MRKIIATEKAPAAIGPYSQANVVGNLVFTSGQLAINPETGDLVPGGIREQTEQAMKNLQAILEEAGSGLDKVLKTTCYLSDINNFVPMNEVYATFFPEGIYPSRSAFEVANLPKSGLVEIEAIAML